MRLNFYYTRSKTIENLHKGIQVTCYTSQLLHKLLCNSFSASRTLTSFISKVDTENKTCENASKDEQKNYYFHK